METKKINLSEKFDAFDDYWNPRIVGELNGQLVKVAKFRGEFVRHHHEDEDELFLVIEGTLLIELPDKTLEINPGEIAIIPRGVEHKPKASGEVKVVLIEPKTTLNTGNLENKWTRKNLENL
ncbi:MAG: cupin domain-containing protein [Robiginitalea sp.]